MFFILNDWMLSLGAIKLIRIAMYFYSVVSVLLFMLLKRIDHFPGSGDTVTVTNVQTNEQMRMETFTVWVYLL